MRKNREAATALRQQAEDEYGEDDDEDSWPNGDLCLLTMVAAPRRGGRGAALLQQ